MIAFIEGILDEVHPLKVIINAGGVGYELNTPLSTSSQAGKIGEKIRLLTQLVVREDSQQLYGFATQQEKSAFVALTEKVSGIGPRIALNILSRLSVEALYSAVTSQNVSLLTQCPGIGKKTAERLVLELKDVFAKQPLINAVSSAGTEPEPVGILTAQNSMVDDAVAALVTLGFKPVDAQRRVERVLKKSPEEMKVELIIKEALSN